MWRWWKPYQVWFSQAASLLDEHRLILAGSLLQSVRANATFMHACAKELLLGVCVCVCLYLAILEWARWADGSWHLHSHHLSPQEGCVSACVDVEILNIAAHFPSAWQLGGLHSDVGHLSHLQCILVGLWAWVWGGDTFQNWTQESSKWKLCCWPAVYQVNLTTVFAHVLSGKCHNLQLAHSRLLVMRFIISIPTN